MELAVLFLSSCALHNTYNKRTKRKKGPKCHGFQCQSLQGFEGKNRRSHTHKQTLHPTINSPLLFLFIPFLHFLHFIHSYLFLLQKSKNKFFVFKISSWESVEAQCSQWHLFPFVQRASIISYLPVQITRSWMRNLILTFPGHFLWIFLSLAFWLDS